MDPQPIDIPIQITMIDTLNLIAQFNQIYPTEKAYYEAEATNQTDEYLKNFAKQNYEFTVSTHETYEDLQRRYYEDLKELNNSILPKLPILVELERKEFLVREKFRGGINIRSTPRRLVN